MGGVFKVSCRSPTSQGHASHPTGAQSSSGEMGYEMGILANIRLKAWKNRISKKFPDGEQPFDATLAEKGGK